MEKTKKFWHKEFWTRGKIIKWSVIFAIIIALVIGFAHQHYIHSQGFIKQRLSDSEELFTTTAENMLDKPTTSKDFIYVEQEQQRIGSDTKISIQTLINNARYEDFKDDLISLESLGVDYIKSNGKQVRFYTTERFVYIYAPDVEDVGGAEKIFDGWYYTDAS